MEFDLSLKKRYGELSSFSIKRTYYFDIDDVKKFIKKLKDRLGDTNMDIYTDEVKAIIDKLAGKELSEVEG